MKFKLWSDWGVNRSAARSDANELKGKHAELSGKHLRRPIKPVRYSVKLGYIWPGCETKWQIRSKWPGRLAMPLDIKAIFWRTEASVRRSRRTAHLYRRTIRWHAVATRFSSYYSLSTCWYRLLPCPSPSAVSHRRQKFTLKMCRRRWATRMTGGRVDDMWLTTNE